MTDVDSTYRRYFEISIDLATCGSYRRCPDTSELGMNAELIKVLRRHNVKIQTASDAHCPEDVGLYIRDLEEKLEAIRND